MTQEQLIAQMTPELKKLWVLFDQIMKASGIAYRLQEVLRTPAVQAAYWAQGRLKLDEVNEFRREAGLPPINAEANRNKITWTHNSRHFAGSDGLATAFDIVLLRDGKPHWDINRDGNKNSVKDYLEAARIGKEVGLEPGAFWEKFKDWPHFQLPRSSK